MKARAMKLGTETGSFFNHLMSNNSTLPEVGKGATIMHWTDREACQVIRVSADKKEALIQHYADYKAERLTEYFELIVWRNNAWRRVVEQVVWKSDEKYEEWRKLPQSEKDKFFVTDDIRLRLIDGWTKVKKEYPKVNIIWGVIDPYYDPSF